MERIPRGKHTQEKRQERQIINMQRQEELQGKLGKEKKILHVVITIVNLVRYINISGIWGKIHTQPYPVISSLDSKSWCGLSVYTAREKACCC